jgi:hypothetical protein
MFADVGEVIINVLIIGFGVGYLLYREWKDEKK